MVCQECGSVIQVPATLCPVCGLPPGVAATTPTPDPARKAGADTAVSSCPACGTTMGPADRFCPNPDCGDEPATVVSVPRHLEPPAPAVAVDPDLTVSPITVGAPPVPVRSAPAVDEDDTQILPRPPVWDAAPEPTTSLATPEGEPITVPPPSLRFEPESPAPPAPPLPPTRAVVEIAPPHPYAAPAPPHPASPVAAEAPPPPARAVPPLPPQPPPVGVVQPRKSAAPWLAIAAGVVVVGAAAAGWFYFGRTHTEAVPSSASSALGGVAAPVHVPEAAASPTGAVPTSEPAAPAVQSPVVGAPASRAASQGASPSPPEPAEPAVQQVAPAAPAVSEPASVPATQALPVPLPAVAASRPDPEPAALPPPPAPVPPQPKDTPAAAGESVAGAAASGSGAAAAEPAAERVPTSVPEYGGPTSGTLKYSGPKVVQNGEVVFRGLPGARLSVSYNKEVWALRIVPAEGGKQNLVLRNTKPGTQKECVVYWRVIQ